MHRSAEFWDPLEFRPERHTAEAKAERPRFVYFPFGGGRRQCIGEGFAWMEGVLSLATIAQRWRLSFVPTYPVVAQAKITLRPKYPMMMVASSGRGCVGAAGGRVADGLVDVFGAEFGGVAGEWRRGSLSSWRRVIFCRRRGGGRIHG
jgi:hypothetical protein